MQESIAYLIATLFRWRKRLLIRFAVTSLGRAATSMAVIFFIHEFLASAVEEKTGFTSALAATCGQAGVLWIAAALLLGTYILSALLNYDNQVVVQRIVKVIELGVMERVIRHLLALSVPYADRQSHGDIIQTVRTDVTQLRTVVQSASNIFLEMFVAAGLLAAAVWTSPSLAVWALLVLPAISLPVMLLSKQIRARSYTVRTTGYVLFDMVLEILEGMRVIKAYQSEEMQARMSIEKGRSYFDELIQMVRLRALGRVAMESLAGLSVVVVILVGGFQVIDGRLSWPALLAFVMAVRALHTPLNLIHIHYVQIQTRHASVRRIADFLATEPEVQDLPGARPLQRPPKRIECEHVGFAYDGKEVLHDISFSVAAGESIGIVGPSGAGKSTLLNLLVRLYDPTTGRVVFDEMDLRRVRLADLYRHVAIVAQDPFLFSATVRENIRCGRPAATDAEVQAAAQAARIHDEILTMPAGYDTQIGAGGQGVSRGQAQRINIARAFLKNAPILLLDEATSSLDSVAESQVQQAIDRLLEARTSFVVAHRLSTLRQADRLVVLDRGRCVGIGTHTALLAECPLYQRLWEAQQLDDRRPRGEHLASPRGD